MIPGLENHLTILNSLQNLKYWNKPDTQDIEISLDGIKRALFKLFTQLVVPIDCEQRPKQKNIRYILANLTLETTVCISFMQSESQWKASAEYLKDFWGKFSLIRIERLLAVLNIFDPWVVCIFVLILVPFLSLAFSMFLTLRRTKIWNRMLRALILFPFHILNSFLGISILSTLTACFNYSLGRSGEFESQFRNFLHFTHEGISALIIFLLITHFLLVSVSKLILTETRHDLAILVPYAKTSIRSDFYKLLGFHGLLLSYYFILNSLAWLHYLMIFTGCGAMWIYYYRKHPYYIQRINGIYSTQFSVVGFVAFCYFVGEMMKDNTVSFTLSAFTTPFVAVISYVAMINKLPRIQNDLMENIDAIDCPDACELLLRPYLLSRSPNASKLLSKLYKNENIYQKKLLNILDSYYTYTTLKDKTLTRVKLSLTHGYSDCIELDYRYYQCRKLASKDSISETLQYLRYCKLYIETQSHDYELCMRLKNLWSDLSNAKTSGSKVRGHIVKVRSLLKMSNLGYSKLIDRFPTIPASYENYGTLLSWIYNDSLNYLAYLHDAEFLKNEFVNTSRVDAFSPFHPNTGVMVIACNPKIFGRIMFCNESACDILKTSLSDLIGSCFLDLIPENYRQNHTYLLQDLLESRKCTQISSHSGMIYLLDSSQFLVPVKCLMRFDALGNFPCCLITFSGCTNSLEVALIDHYGHIQTHSRNFCRYISIPNRFLQGHNIYTYIPRLRQTHLQPIRLHNSKKVILMTHAFRSECLHIVYVYADKKDFEEIDLSRVCKYSTKYSIEESKGFQLEDLVEMDASMEESKFFEGSITQGDNSNSSKFISHMDKVTDQFKVIQSIALPMHYGSANNTSFKSKSGSFEAKNKKFMKDIKQNVNRLKIVFGVFVRFMQVLLLVAVNTAIAVTIGSTVRKSMDIGDIDRYLNGVKYHVNYLRNNIRELDINNRIPSNHISNITNYQKIESSIQHFNTTLSGLQDLISKYDLEDFYEQVFISESTLIYDLIDSSPVQNSLNFIDILYKYIFHAQNILNLDPGTISLLIPDSYFLFQNSFIHVIKLSNRIIKKLNHMEYNMLIDMRANLMYGVLGVSSLILLFAGFIIKTLVKMQKSSDRVWNLILSLKIKVLDVLRLNVIYRLKFTHKVDSNRNRKRNIEKS